MTKNHFKVWQVLRSKWEFLTKCDRYYKVRKEPITKRGRYYNYKVWRLLQSETKQGTTKSQWHIENRRATSGGRGGRPPLLFLENQKKCPDFGKKSPNCVHSWVESSIQNVVLRVSSRKSSKIFLCGVFFCVFDKKFIEVP